MIITFIVLRGIKFTRPVQLFVVVLEMIVNGKRAIGMTFKAALKPGTSKSFRFRLKLLNNVSFLSFFKNYRKL